MNIGCLKLFAEFTWVWKSSDVGWRVRRMAYETCSLCLWQKEDDIRNLCSGLLYLVLSRPVESQFGAPGKLRSLVGPPAGSLTPEHGYKIVLLSYNHAPSEW